MVAANTLFNVTFFHPRCILAALVSHPLGMIIELLRRPYDKMNPIRLPTPLVCSTLCVWAATLCLPMNAADRLDAPGPGYRSQAAPQLLEPHTPSRSALVLPETVDPLRPSLLPGGTRPELPHTNPFDAPIRLFPRAGR